MGNPLLALALWGTREEARVKTSGRYFSLSKGELREIKEREIYIVIKR
jgi:hypothetical protein